MASKAAALALFGLTRVAAQSSTPSSPLPLTWVTSGSEVINLERCGYHPFIDYAVSLTPTDGSAAGPPLVAASAFIASGGTVNDTLIIDPDPFRLCAPPLAINCTSPCGPTIDMTGAGRTISLAPLGAATMSAADVTSCMRRLFLASTAFGGEEGVGTRVIGYTATTASGVTVSSVVPNRVTYVDPPSDEACGLLTSSRVFVTAGDSPTAVPYFTGCPNAFLCRNEYVLIYPNATVTIPEPWASSGDPFSTFVERVELTFRPFSRIGLPPYDPSADRLWVLPDPALGPSAATCDSPCPGITVLPTVSAAAGAVGDFLGITLYGPASPEAFTSCLRRVYYFNTALGSTAGVTLLGPRPVGITAVSPVRSSITTSSGIARFDAVNVTGTCPPRAGGLPGGATVCGTPGPDSPPCCPFLLTAGCLAPEYIVRGGPIVFPPTVPVATPLVTVGPGRPGLPTASATVPVPGVLPGSGLPSSGPGIGKATVGPGAAAQPPSGGTGAPVVASGLTGGGSGGSSPGTVTNGAGNAQSETAFLMVGLGLAAAVVEARAAREL